MRELNIQFPNLADILVNAEAIKNARLINQKNKTILDEFSRSRSLSGRMAPLVNQGNIQGASDVAAAEGDLAQVQAMQKSKAETVDAQQKTGKSRLENMVKISEYVAPSLHEIAQHPDQQERAALVQTLIGGISEQMEALNPGWTEQVLNQIGDGDKGRLAVAAAAGIKVVDQLRNALDIRKQDFAEGPKFDLEKDQFGETQSQNQLSNDLEFQKLDLNQQQFAETQAQNKAENLRKQQEAAMGGKPPPHYTWAGPNRLQYIPGGAGDPSMQKLGETQQKMLVGANNTASAITDYIQQLDGFSITDIVNPDARAAMGTKYNNMLLQAKEAYNLGVLSGPDLGILQSILTDPTSAQGLIVSKRAMKGQAQELQRIMGNIANVAAQKQQPQAGGSEIQQMRQGQQMAAPANISPENLQYTAKKYGITPEQVIQMLQQRIGQ
jgi:hypothetical protein